ncbi:MAG: hypothetical protein ACNI27_07420 [Desulfovibrio sp.]
MEFYSPKNATFTKDELLYRDFYRDIPLTEYLGARAGNAWDWTSVGRWAEEFQIEQAERDAYGTITSAQDSGNWLGIQEAKNGIAKRPTLSQEEWTASDHFREGIEYDPKMTPIRAQALAQNYDARRERERIINKSPFGARSFLGFAVELGVSALDPVNYIPFIGQATRTKAIVNMGSVVGRAAVGAADAAISTAAMNVPIYMDLKSRGEKLEFSDYALDVLMGGAVGLAFGAGQGGWAKWHGENREALNASLQASIMQVDSGKAADVGSVVKELVERNQFTRAEARERMLVDYSPEEVDGFLQQIDELADGAGVTPDEFMRTHVAEIRTGLESVDGVEGTVRFMKLSEAKSFEEYFKNPSGVFKWIRVPDRLAEKAKKLGVEWSGLGMEHEPHNIKHGKKRHPDMKPEDWDLYEERLQHLVHLERGDDGRAHHKGAKMYIGYADIDGELYGFSFEHNEGRRHNSVIPRTYFKGTEKGIADWLDRNKKRKGLRSADGETAHHTFEKHIPYSSARPSNNTIKQRIKIFKQSIDKLQRAAANALPVLYVKRREHLPKHVQDLMGEGTTKGVYDSVSGKVWMVASEIESPEEAVKVWLHEQVGHHGLRGFLGDRLNPVLDQVYTLMGKKHFEPYAKVYELDLSTVEGRRIATEELLAKAQEKRSLGAHMSVEERSLLEKFFVALRKIFGNGEIKEMQDIADLLEDSLEWTMHGKAKAKAKAKTPPTKNIRFASDGHGAVEFLPDGRAMIHILKGADLSTAAPKLSAVLNEHFAQHPPQKKDFSRVDDSVEEEWAKLPEAPDEDAYLNDTTEMLDLEVLEAQGKLSEEDAFEIMKARAASEETVKISEASKVAAECSTRGGM